MTNDPTMTSGQGKGPDDERRAEGIRRVSVNTVVEICGRERGVPAFEAEAVELSGRGMQVRTPYLPKLNAPLVCRLEDNGREIVVEGVVAWRSDEPSGGQFGIKFTALDAGSVDALASLCGIGEGAGEPTRSARALDPQPLAAEAAPARTERATAAERSEGASQVGAAAGQAPQLVVRDAPGLPVKLHIDGLGSPMKARVKRGSPRRLHVGSNLEFLKVGRSLQVEDVERGERHAAKIDAVAVSIDPQTQVPQLVVSLRYEGVEDVTPEPSVVDTAQPEAPGDVAASPVAKERAARPALDSLSPLASAARSEESVFGDDGSELDDEDEELDEASLVRERLGVATSAAAEVARRAGGTLSRAGVSLGRGMGAALAATGGKLAELREQRRQAQGKAQAGVLRQQRGAVADPSRRRPEPQRLRPQNGTPRQQPATASMKKKPWLAAAAGLSVVLVGVGFAVAKRDAGVGKPAAALTAAAPAASAASPAGPAQPATGPAQPASVAAAAPAAAPATPTDPRAVVANVPLFGPTPMATMEPAPLGPPPDGMDEADSVPAAADEEVAPQADDQSFDEPAAKKGPEKAAQPEEVEPWGYGRLYLPVVHRIDLDAPGEALRGSRSDEGFSVVIPKRKAKDSGRLISRADDRIAAVSVDNGAAGARITFRFRGKVPPYKVRLRKNKVEFFISSPEKR